jgi:cystathionine beta-lyase/cystathionine gamma-synthase
MLPTSVTRRALTFTQAVLNMTTRVTHVVQDANTRVHTRVERVHLDAVDRGYRAEYTRDQDFQTAVDKSRAVKALCDKVAELESKQQSLTFLCKVLAACVWFLLIFFTSR